MRVERAERRLEAGDPEGRRLERHLFSWRACGAWSVVIALIVPSRSASIRAARSSWLRRGGFIFKFESSVLTAFVGETEVVRCHFRGCLDATLARGSERRDGFSRSEAAAPILS